MLILGIESSCDETAVSVVKCPPPRILSSLVASQDEVHARYGGVVPELASRRHLETAVPLLNGALKEAKISLKDIDGIAVTHAPGLLGSLLVGIQLAKGIALATGKPIIGVNHLEGHLNAIALEKTEVPYPHVGLVVSGGHTSLYHVEGFGEYKLLGATRDDAAGEAFDKVAKLLNLGYPGGPIVDQLSLKGNPKAFSFPPPHFGYWNKNTPPTLDFSFSGIKTAVLLKHKQALNQGTVSEQFTADIVASFQDCVVNFLSDRIFAALKETNAKAIVVSGGVAANNHLRNHLQNRCEQTNITCLIPSIKLCTDNAAMIAYVGGEHLKRGLRSDMSLNAIANQEIGV